MNRLASLLYIKCLKHTTVVSNNSEVKLILDDITPKKQMPHSNVFENNTKLMINLFRKRYQWDIRGLLKHVQAVLMLI